SWRLDFGSDPAILSARGSPACSSMTWKTRPNCPRATSETTRYRPRIGVWATDVAAIPRCQLDWQAVSTGLALRHLSGCRGVCYCAVVPDDDRKLRRLGDETKGRIADLASGWSVEPKPDPAPAPEPPAARKKPRTVPPPPPGSVARQQLEQAIVN